ncbi:MAG: hypothetical protein HPY69_05055 [Armatimonadetes bacterium]|nr:hypothetical protein [Armatimonadota bacterium]
MGLAPVTAAVLAVLLLVAPVCGEEGGWLHPAGLVNRENVRTMREKVRRYQWAREVQEGLVAGTRRWMEVPVERLRELTPTRRGNVYHNFTCPADNARLTFDPFEDKTFSCPACGKTYAADQESTVYPEGEAYHGTLYDGWSCLYFIAIAHACWHMGLVYQLTGDEAYARRARDILLIYADNTPKMAREEVGGSKVIFTYNREGETRILEFAGAYDLIRDSGVLSDEQKAHIEGDFLKPFCEDVFMDPEMRMDWNNVFWWQLAIAQVGVALEDRRYLDYAFGLGDYSPAKRPQHRSLAYSATHHFRPDGAHFGLNTGYQLYPLTALLQTIALGANLAQQEPKRFPPAEFDLRDPQNPVGDVARRAVYWYLALALPDYTMATVGDSMLSRDSLKAYDPIAELAYQYFGVNEVAYYPQMNTTRGLWGLLWGAPEVVRRPVRFESARLSSGFTALRKEYGGKRLYVGLNHLQPGDGHQHADRLGIITYACDRLLGLEKGTPYNDYAVREVARASYGHNTVTVDRRSQPNGSQLRGEQVPQVKWFVSDPEVEFAEVWGDRIYGQTERYRRAVAIVDDLVVDVFDVVGGATRDWLYHCQGNLDIGLPLEAEEEFDTPAYVVGGTAHCERAETDGNWQARWTLPASSGAPYAGRRRPVRHQVTMLGAEGTEVFRLGTYPVQPAADGESFAEILTGGQGAAEGATCKGLTQTLLARRKSGQAPFVAVYDTYHVRPSLRGLEMVGTSAPGAVVVRLQGRGSERWVVYNPNAVQGVRFGGPWGGARFEGHFAVIRMEPSGEVSGLSLVGAKLLRLGSLSVELAEAGNVFMTRRKDGRFAARTWADLAYETVAGENVVAPCPARRVRVRTGAESYEVLAREGGGRLRSRAATSG